MPISGGTTKQAVVWPRNEILFLHKKEWSADTSHSVNGPQDRDIKGKEPDPKGHVSYDSIYIKYPERVKSWKEGADWWLPRAEGRENGD